MRSLLVFLLLANLGCFASRRGWVLEERTAIEESHLFRSGGQALVLISELPAERRRVMASLREAQATRAGAGRELLSVQQEANTVERQIAEVVGDIGEDRADSAQVRQNSLADNVASTLFEPVPWCARAGAFADQAAASAFVAELAELEVKGVLELREERVSSTWWVHMPVFESEAAARAMLAELQAKNVDSYYMRSGEMAGGISLGVFSRRESASIAQQQLADQGYSTSIREVARMGERPYVVLAMPDKALRQAPEWAAFLGRSGGIELSENACEMIASENEFP
jgi:hypothetical protein